MEDELKKYGLKVYWKSQEGHNSDDPDDYEPIDFSIEDNDGNVALVWGSEPYRDVQVECNHPEQYIEFGDNCEQGECNICGATCDWRWTDDIVDEGHNEDGTYFAQTGQRRQIEEWHKPEKIGGIVGKCLKQLQERW